MSNCNEMIQGGSGGTMMNPADRSELLLLMRGMADMVRATNERMAAMERDLRLLTKVTGAQSTEINKAIRARAEQMCEAYSAPGCDKAVAAAIRREIRLMCGVDNMRELPRCEYSVVMRQIGLWDDRKTVRAVKQKADAAATRK
ncbi:MAG: hypothetical protein RSE23_01750 [Clostridia bacterium]